MDDFIIIEIDETHPVVMELSITPPENLPLPDQNLPSPPAGATIRLLRRTFFSWESGSLQVLPPQAEAQLITKITCKIDVPFYDDSSATLQLVTSSGDIIASTDEFLTQSEYEIDFDDNFILPANTGILLVVTTAGAVGGGVIYIDYHKGVLE